MGGILVIEIYLFNHREYILEMKKQTSLLSQINSKVNYEYCEIEDQQVQNGNNNDEQPRG